VATAGTVHRCGRVLIGVVASLRPHRVPFPGIRTGPAWRNTRHNAGPDLSLIAETLATTCRDAAKIDHRRRPPIGIWATVFEFGCIPGGGLS